MDIREFENQINEDVVRLMMSYLEEFEEDEDAPFTEDDVEACRDLLVTFLHNLDELEAPSDEDIMAEVENVVIALNELSEETDYAMIETMEREAICEIIQEAAVAAGLEEEIDDVTEEWREW